MKHMSQISFRALGALCLASAVALAGACAEQDQVDTETDTTEVAAHEGAKTKHHKDPAQSAAWMKDKLGLSADQAAELETALGQVETHEEKRSALEAILTTEQMAQFDEMHKAHKGKKGWHHKNKHKDPAAHAAKLQNKLGLTDEQTAQVEGAFRDSETHEQKKAALKSILTADQMTELEALHADKRHRKAMKHHKGHKGHKKDPAAHAAKLQSKLGLTDEQTAQVEAALRDSESHDDKRAAMESILTEEQMEQLREMHQRRRGHYGHDRKR